MKPCAPLLSLNSAQGWVSKSKVIPDMSGRGGLRSSTELMVLLWRLPSPCCLVDPTAWMAAVVTSSSLVSNLPPAMPIPRFHVLLSFQALAACPLSGGHIRGYLSIFLGGVILLFPATSCGLLSNPPPRGSVERGPHGSCCLHR